ncbi:TPA: hypothetical protein QCR73_005718 [Bacillus anthracis]|nr:hypothetical protein [Bacillus anthracis]
MKLIEGFHLRRLKSGRDSINRNIKYSWNIPERLTGKIDKGDIVWVHCKSEDKDRKSRVLVVDIVERDERALRSVIKVAKKFDKVNLDLN